MTKLYSPDEIFQYVVDYKKNTRGDSPSVREIMEAFGVASTNTVHMILRKLERQGKIKITDGRRQIEVIGSEWVYPIESVL